MMISEYKDMLEKARFYKKQVIQSFIKQGYFPSDEEIQTALSDIDMTYELRVGRTPTNVSIDKIDHTKGYTMDNI